jgi:hypothetical protein
MQNCLRSYQICLLKIKYQKESFVWVGLTLIFNVAEVFSMYNQEMCKYSESSLSFMKVIPNLTGDVVCVGYLHYRIFKMAA